MMKTDRGYHTHYGLKMQRKNSKTRRRDENFENRRFLFGSLVVSFSRRLVFSLSLLLVSSLLLFLSVGSGWAQGFGKNKVTDQDFDWLIHRTEHFDIHYYPGEEQLVSIMADIVEEAYEKHSEDFEHELKDRTPLILYQSHKDFSRDQHYAG